MSAINFIGVKPGSRVLNVLVVLKVGALGDPDSFRIPCAIAPALVGDRAIDRARLLTILAFGAALVPILFAYGGWQNANYVAEEIEDPQRNLPISIIGGTIAVVAIYVLVNIVYLRALGLEGLATTTTPAADAARRMFGPVGDRFVTAAIAISTFGFLDLAILAPTRVYYAMAADGLFFPALGQSASDISDARRGDRRPDRVVVRAGFERHLRTAAQLRRVRRLDFLRPHGRDRHRLQANVPARAAVARVHARRAIQSFQRCLS